ncbi:MAG: BadF/BadG/BcrA/BcrD ATPase family protein [Chloroflexota bacterium]
MAQLVLGIDGGGSKTSAVLADAAGTVLGVGIAGASNYQAIGFDNATQSISAAIADARQKAALPLETVVDAACFGLSGIDRPHEQAQFTEWVKSQNIAKQHMVVNDAEILLAAGTPDGWGIALICGTGSICYGHSPGGQIARSGGWGYLLGDEGSGYDIAVHALRWVTQTADGRANANTLLRATLNHFKLDNAEQLIGYVYRPEATQAEIATLARVVVQLAENKDPYAYTILDQAGRELSRVISAVVRKLELHEPHVALGGGVLHDDSVLWYRTNKHVHFALGPATRVDEPVYGAVILARRLVEAHNR